MNNTRHYYLCISGLILSLYSSQGLTASGCVVLDGKNYTVLTASIPLDPDAPNGSIIYRRYIDTAGAKISCLSGSASYASRMSNEKITGNNSDGNIFETGIPGVGVQVTDLYASNRIVPYKTSLSPNNLLPSWNPTERTRVDFIKTGTILTGSIKSGTLVTYKVDDYTVATLNVRGNQGWVVKSCAIDAADRNKTVQLGSYRASDFKGIGTTSVDKSFSLKLNCQKDSTPVYVSFEPTTGSLGNGLLNIDSTVSGAASGVSIEILSGSTPLVFSEEVEYHTTAQDVVTLLYTARYKQTNKYKCHPRHREWCNDIYNRSTLIHLKKSIKFSLYFMENLL